MIARIRYEDSELGSVTATLSEDGVWTADDPTIQNTLNAMVKSEDKSPARGDWMAWHAEQMAVMLDGKLELAPKDEPEGPELRY